MAEFQFETLRPKLSCENTAEACGPAQAALVEYLTGVLVYCEAGETSDVLAIVDQLNLLVEYLLETYKDTKEVALLSVEVNRLLAKDFSCLFGLLLEGADAKFSTKLLDLTSRMCDVVVANAKKLSMHNTWYSWKKHLAVILLQFLFDRFNGFLNMYKAGVLTAIYKHLVKCCDNYNSAVDAGVFKANYFTDLAALADVIVAHDNSSGLLDDKLFHRLTKLSRYVCKRDSHKAFIYPLPAIIHAFNLLTSLLKSDRYVSGLSSKKTSTNPNYYFHTLEKTYLYQYVLAMDSDHKQLRLLVTKDLADLLVFNYVVFGANTQHTDSVLQNSISFLLTNYMKLPSSQGTKAGLLECLTAFVAKMNLYYETNSISASDGSKTPVNFVALKLFVILNTICYTVFKVGESVGKANSKNQLFQPITADSPSDLCLRTLQDLHHIYAALLRELDSDVNELLVLGQVVLGTDNDTDIVSVSTALANTPENPWYALSLLDLAQLIIADIGEYVMSRQESIAESHEQVGKQVAAKMVEWATHSNLHIRTKAVQTLMSLVQIDPRLVHGFLGARIDTLCKTLESKDRCPLNELHGNALLVSAMLAALQGRDQVPDDHVLRVYTEATGLVKRFNTLLSSNNLLGGASATTTPRSVYEKQKACWTLLMGLFHFASALSSSNGAFWLDGSQFLGIWNTLLGHSLPSGFVAFEKDDKTGIVSVSNLAEVIPFLEIKSNALLCMCCYIKTLHEGSGLGADLARKLNLLLTKCFTFGSNLRTQIVGGGAEIAPELETALVVNKQRIYHGVLMLLPFLDVSSDLSSALLLQVVKDFTDVQKYRYAYTSDDKSKDYELYRVCDSVNFGLTSKFAGFEVQELMIKGNEAVKDESFDIDSASKSRTIESTRVKSHLAPSSVFDFSFEDISALFSHSLLNDSQMLLFVGSSPLGYTDSCRLPVGHDTMVVDLAVEIFALALPRLAAKVQQSLIENIRTAVFYQAKESREQKPKDPADKEKDTPLLLRKKAVTVNAAITIHSAVSYMQRSHLALSTKIGDLICSTVRNFDNADAYVSSLNCETVGLCCGLVQEEDVPQAQVAASINSIVQNEEPTSRAFELGVLASVACRHRGLLNSHDISETLLTLCLDPHPVVQAAALDGVASILGAQSPTEMNRQLVWRVLRLLQQIAASDEFGVHGTATVSSNMSFRRHLSITVLTSRIVRAIVNVCGPTIASWPEPYKKSLRNLVVGLIFLTTDHYVAISRELVKTLEELAVYDRELVADSLHSLFLQFLLSNNFRLGVYGASLSCMPLDRPQATFELYPTTTSDVIWAASLDSCRQLISLHGSGSTWDPLAEPQLETLVWLCLERQPGSTCVRHVFDQMLEEAVAGDRLKWLDRLIDHFGMSKAVLEQSLLELYKKRIENGGMFFRASMASSAAPGNKHKPTQSIQSVASTVSSAKFSEEEVGGNIDGNIESLTGTGAADSDEDVSSVAAPKEREESGGVQLLNVQSDQTSWGFRLAVVEMLNGILTIASGNERVKLFLSRRIADFVRIAFICSTSSLVSLRVSALKMLGQIIEVYAPMKDPQYPEVSVLDQQQAQIAAAIVPAFDRESTPDLAAEAVVLASQLVTSRITPVTRLGRLLKILTQSLEEFGLNDKKIVKIGDVTVTDAASQTKVKTHVLQAWARIKSNADQSDKPLQLLVQKYSAVLVPLWFYSMRDFAMKRYSSTSSSASVPFPNSSWVDILAVLGIIAQEDPQQFNELLGDETANFFFVVFGQCMELLISHPVSSCESQVLQSLTKLLRLDVAVQIVFKDLIFPEVVDLLDRLVTIASPQNKLLVVDLSKTIFTAYFNSSSAKTAKSEEELAADVDKLFELIRINTLAISQTLPFIKDRLVVREKIPAVSQSGLALLKKSFDATVQMVEFLPQVMRIDLYSCVLYMFTLIYEFGDPATVSTLLPTLKRAIANFDAVDASNPNLVGFYAAIKDHLDPQKSHSLLTVLIIVSTLHQINISAAEADSIADFICSGLVSEDTSLVALATQTIKSLIDGHNSAVLVKLVPRLVELVSDPDSQLQEPRLSVQILVTLAKSLEDEAAILAALQLIVPTLVWFAQNPVYAQYAHSRLLDLVQFKPLLFKKYVEEQCTSELKEKVEALVKLNTQEEKTEDDDVVVSTETVAEAHINLKTFE